MSMSTLVAIQLQQRHQRHQAHQHPSTSQATLQTPLALAAPLPPSVTLKAKKSYSTLQRLQQRQQRQTPSQPLSASAALATAAATAAAIAAPPAATAADRSRLRPLLRVTAPQRESDMSLSLNVPNVPNVQPQALSATTEGVSNRNPFFCDCLRDCGRCGGCRVGRCGYKFSLSCIPSNFWFCRLAAPIRQPYTPFIIHTHFIYPQYHLSPAPQPPSSQLPSPPASTTRPPPPSAPWTCTSFFFSLPSS
jgi:hypothetical protein